MQLPAEVFRIIKFHQIRTRAALYLKKKKSFCLRKRDLYLHNKTPDIRKRVLRSVDSFRTVREREGMQIEREVERERELERASA